MKENTDYRFAFYLPYAAAMIHGWWGICVLRTIDNLKELETTGLKDVYPLFGHNRTLTGICLILFSIMAIASIHMHRSHRMWSGVLLAPQQGIMLLSMNRAYWCIMQSKFADGASYDPNFISADQCYLACFATAHSLLIVHLYWADRFFSIFGGRQK